jgi:hypothetical protein
VRLRAHRKVRRMGLNRSGRTLRCPVPPRARPCLDTNGRYRRILSQSR